MAKIDLMELKNLLKKKMKKGFIADSEIPVVKVFLGLTDKSILSGTCSECSNNIQVHCHKLMLGHLESLRDLHKKFGVKKEFRLKNEIPDRVHFQNFQKLRYLKLAQKKVVNEKTKKVSWSMSDAKAARGVWRLTNLAEKFLSGNAKIASEAFTFNGQVLFTEGEMTVKDRLGPWLTRRNYAESAQSILAYVKVLNRKSN